MFSKKFVWEADADRETATRPQTYHPPPPQVKNPPTPRATRLSIGDPLRKRNVDFRPFITADEIPARPEQSSLFPKWLNREEGDLPAGRRRQGRALVSTQRFCGKGPKEEPS